jgi:hypothetical protein
MPDISEEYLHMLRVAADDVRAAHSDVRRLSEELRAARTRLKESAHSARSIGMTLAGIGTLIGTSRQNVHEMLR